MMKPYHSIHNSGPGESRRPGPWMVLSLILHFLLVVILWGWSAWVDQPDVAKPLDVVYLDRDPDRKQIVDIPELAPKEKPEESRFLSEHNQRVDQETKAPREKPSAWEEATVQKKSSTSSLSESLETNVKKSPSEPEEVNSNGQENTESIFKRSETDYLPDIELGEKTYINAEAFKNTSYYLEIKRKIELTWNPNSVLRQTMQRGISIQRGVLATYLGVTLEPDGALYDIQVLDSSGVPALDQEATRSFQVNAPFTQPPKELLSNDGRLRFEFGFIIYGR